MTRSDMDFSAYHISSVEEMRRLHSEKQLPELPAADIILVVDGWATLRKDFEDVADAITDLAQRGLGFGIHVVFATGRWHNPLPARKIIPVKMIKTQHRKILPSVRHTHQSTHTLINLRHQQMHLNRLTRPGCATPTSCYPSHGSP